MTLRKISIFLVLSLLLNAYLAISIIKKSEGGKKEAAQIEEINQRHHKKDADLNINTEENFKKVFLQRNDSLYKQIWNHSFEDYPMEAFMVSCSYYLVTRDPKIRHDIEISSSQLESTYNSPIQFETPDIREKQKNK